MGPRGHVSLNAAWRSVRPKAVSLMRDSTSTVNSEQTSLCMMVMAASPNAAKPEGLKGARICGWICR